MTGDDVVASSVADVRTSTPTWSVRVLGTVAVERAGSRVALGGPQQRSVLLRLVLAGGMPVSVDALLDQLWPDRRPASATNTLQSYISTLRRRLRTPGGGPVLMREGAGYRCTIPVGAVDAFRFEQLLREAEDADPVQRVRVLGQAVASWGGPPFPEFADEPWARSEAARLRELHEVAVERLAAARLDAGRPGLVVPELEVLVAESPLREERWRLLALALYRTGRQADALAALRRARQVLADELGVDPGPALRRTESAVLAQSPELDGPEAPTSRRPGPAAPTEQPGDQPAGAPPEDLVLEREGELSSLRSWADDLRRGRGGFSLIEGVPGVGKTRLLQELAALLARDALVLTARATPLEKGYAFGVVRQLLEPPLQDPERRAALLGGAASAAASVFDLAPVGAPGPDIAFSVLNGVYRLVAALASDCPVVLAIDDLQWCDVTSLRAVAYVVGRLHGLRVLVAATRRDGEPHDAPELYAELTEHPEVRLLRPQALTPTGVTALVARQLGRAPDPEFVRACHGATGGNPLLLRQLLRALEAERVPPDAAHADATMAIGSRAIANLVQLRLARLGKDAAAVAAAVAVLGERAELPAVAALAEVGEAACAGAIAALARAEVLRQEPPLGFVHPLVAEAVERGLPPGVRELRHERAARLLAARQAPLEAIASHLLVIPPRADPWVVSTLRAAARDAVSRGATDSAVFVLRRALAEPPDAATRADVLAELGRVEAHVDGPAALTHLREAYDLARDPRLRADIAQALTQTLIFAGRVGEAADFAGNAQADLPADLVDRRQGLEASARMCGYMHGLPAHRWRRTQTSWPEGNDVGARMAAAERALQLTIDGRDRERAVALARFALEDGALRANGLSLFELSAANVLELADDDLSAYWAQAHLDAEATGSPFSLLSVRLWWGHALLRRGELEAAQHSLAVAIDLTARWHVRLGALYSHAFALEVALERGDVPAARAVASGLGHLALLGDGGCFGVYARGRLALAEGRFDEVVGRARTLAQLEPRWRNPAWRPWRSLMAAGLAGLGRPAEAVPLLEQELALAREWGAPRPIGRTLRRLGELLAARGEPALRDAVGILAETPARLELARAEAALARVVGDPDEAGALLRSARGRAESCGAHSLVEDVTATLRGLGEEPSP
ncbi:BTAD domain-containing putative transcriptional regulator [Blastococcus sp. SYSU DS0533]